MVILAGTPSMHESKIFIYEVRKLYCIQIQFLASIQSKLEAKFSQTKTLMAWGGIITW